MRRSAHLLPAMKILDILSYLLAVSGGLAAPSLSAQPAIRIPLTRTVLDAQNTSLPHDGVNEFSKRGGAAVDLHGFRDAVGWVFTGPLKIRNTEFQCLFDTGSHKVLVAGKGCSKDKGCGAGPRYDNGGKRLSKDGRVDYLMGGAQGQLWSDDIAIGGKKAKDQEILVVETMKGVPDSFLSICGMSVNRGDVSGSRTFFSNMMAQVIAPERQSCGCLLRFAGVRWKGRIQLSARPWRLQRTHSWRP